MLRIILVMAFFAFGQAAHAQTPAKFLVDLSIQCEKCEGVLTSFVSRELRDFKDVEIVQKTDHPYTGHKFALSIIAFANYNVGGEKIGYTVSYVATKRLNTRLINEFLNQRLKDAADKYAMSLLLDEASTHEDHRVYSAGPDGLKEIAERIVASFDEICMEPIRARTVRTSKP